MRVNNLPRVAIQYGDYIKYQLNKETSFNTAQYHARAQSSSS